MKKQLLFYLAFTIFGIFFLSCEPKKKTPDTANININLNIHRFDQDLFNLDTNNISEALDDLEKKYPNFFQLYFSRILPLQSRGENDSIFHQNVKGFLSFEPVKKLADTCDIVFKDITDIQNNLKSAFTYYKYYLPKNEVPNIYFLISEYGYQTFLFDDGGKDGIGVGLDMFLGSDYPYSKIDPQNTAFSTYLTRSFSRAHLTKKTVDAIIDDVVGSPKGNRLLDIMVHNGKKLYILDKLLPFTPDSIKLEYKKNQVDWVTNNEKQTWAHFLANDLLYENQSKKIAKLINPSPQAPPGMPAKAPGQIANWMGWQIVKMYMNRNPNKNIEDLIAEKDAQFILDKSKYKPQR